MIGYLNGKLITFYGSNVILETGGVGYEINCTNNCLSRLINNKGGEAYIFTAVREDGIYLYGFDNMDEKEMFLKLTSVSGVGPKAAIAILSHLGANGTRASILNSDVKTLSSVKGLGKKTAEKIIVELRGGLPATSMVGETTAQNEEATEALISTFGFDRNTASKAVALAKEQGAKELEEIIALALRNIK